MNSEMLWSLLVILIVFLIFRELFTWYWKINHIIKKLENIESYLYTIASNTSSESYNEDEDDEEENEDDEYEEADEVEDNEDDSPNQR